MPDSLPLISALAGGLIGAGVAWVVLKQRIAAAVAEKETALRAESSAFETRLRETSAAEKLDLSTRLATFEANAAAYEARITDFQRQGAESEQVVKTLRANLSAAGEHAAALEKRIAEAKAAGAAAEAHLKEVFAGEKLDLSTRLTNTEARATAHAARVEELQREATARAQELTSLRTQRGEAAERIATLETQLTEERQQAQEKLTLLKDAQKQLTTHFESISLQALNKSSANFLELAKAQLGQFQERASGDLAQKQQAIDDLLKPVRESLSRVDGQITEMEKTRAGAYEGLLAQVRSLGETQQQLRGETGRLASALKSTGARGRWGEIQLRRVVELAGMQDHCDFYEQQTVEGETGRLRPDMIVKMPGGKTIVVDSKVPFSAYDRATSVEDDNVRAAFLREHAGAVREHIKALAAKSYWEQFEEAPEFVVLFLPAETFFGAALEHDPELIDFSAKNRVMLSTPTTLIALLRAVHYGWRQEKLAENAQQISGLGRELYERLATLGEHMSKLGRHLDSAVESYNKAAGSLESRVLVSARRFKDLHAASEKELKGMDQIEHTTRTLQSPELFPPTPLAAPELVPEPESAPVEEADDSNRSTPA